MRKRDDEKHRGDSRQSGLLPESSLWAKVIASLVKGRWYEVPEGFFLP